MRLGFKLIAILGFAALTSCANKVRSFSVNENYDRTASCFYRDVRAIHARSNDTWSGSTLRLLRLTHPNEIDISDRQYSAIFASKPWFWTVTFLERSEYLTVVTVHWRGADTFYRRNYRRVKLCAMK